MITKANDKGFEEFLQNVGEGLRNAREKCGYSMPFVAAALNMTENQLMLIEQGKLNWETGVIASLCEYYDISIKEIV